MVGKKTKEELKQLALDISDGKVFTDRHLRDVEDIGMVFMPIPLGAFAKESKEYIDDIGLIYEYWSEAGPRSVNGYPSFFSMTVLGKEDTEQVFKYHEQFEQAKKAVLED